MTSSQFRIVKACFCQSTCVPYDVLDVLDVADVLVRAEERH